MRAIFRISLTLAIAIIVSACSGQDGLVLSGSGESGVGGTGISYVRGNVNAIDDDQPIGGQSTNGSGYSKAESAGTTVSGGGRTATVQQGGSFVLIDVTPQANLILSFKNPNGKVSTLNIGNVGVGETAVVSDVSIEFSSGKASARSIRVVPNNTAGNSTPSPSSGGSSANSNPGSGNQPSGNPCTNDPKNSQGCSESNGNQGNNGNNGNNV